MGFSGAIQLPLTKQLLNSGHIPTNIVTVSKLLFCIFRHFFVHKVPGHVPAVCLFLGEEGGGPYFWNKPFWNPGWGICKLLQIEIFPFFVTGIATVVIEKPALKTGLSTMICLFFNHCVGDHIFIKALYQVIQSDLFTSRWRSLSHWNGHLTIPKRSHRIAR